MNISKNVIKNNKNNPKKLLGFTIVELLVVIVVIGILAGITIVSYTGIANKATISSIQSDLSNASTQFKMFHIENGYYPSSISTNCATNPTSTINLCLKPSPGNSYTTVAYSNPTSQSFILTEVNGNNVYHITEKAPVTLGAFVIDWITVGTQTWTATNLNVGTRVNNTIQQNPANGTIEKYCYDNQEFNCDIYGGLYQWNEAMQNETYENAQGICPTGSHIPSDTDLKTLEVYLGMTQVEADSNGSRGVGQGTKLKSGGDSGLNILIAGFRDQSSTTFINISVQGILWSSTEYGGFAYFRLLRPSFDSVYRDATEKARGVSVRCIKN